MPARLTLMFFAAASLAAADDWPQWMGPQRDGRYRESGLIDAFPEGGPDVQWEAECGLGYAGPAVAGGRVFLFDYVKQGGESFNNPGQAAKLEGSERLRALDVKTGEEVWAYAYDRPYEISYPQGPRATPTVHENRVYLMGAMGDLTCLDADNGARQWAVNLPDLLGCKVPIWGFSSHPLVDGGRVYVMGGGEGSAVVALDSKTGKLEWKARDSDHAGYAPLTIHEYGGVRQLIGWSPRELFSLNPQTGEAYWTHELVPDYGMSIMAPQVAGDRLFAAGIGNKSAVLKLDASAPTAEVAWRDPGPRSLFPGNMTPLIDEGLVYGCDIQSGQLKAVSLADGSAVWETAEPVTPAGFEGRRPPRHATAFLTQVVGQDRFLLFNEAGELIFATLDPKGYAELSRAKVLEPTNEAFRRDVVWSHPAYADRAAFVRNDEKIVRVNLAAE